MPDHDEQRIRDRAHQMWANDGYPENRALHYWLAAEKEIKDHSVPQAENQGEGNYTAAQACDIETRKFVKSGQVEAKAQEAKKALDWPEGEDLKKAEEIGKKRRRRSESPRGAGA